MTALYFHPSAEAITEVTSLLSPVDQPTLTGGNVA